MKRFNRRQFLKTAGAAAGAAVLGQGCAVSPTPTPSRQDVLLEEANILVDGDTVKIPECCLYTGKYHIDHPPKRPIYGIWAEKFIEVIDLLNDAKVNPFPNTDERFEHGISDCLGFAVDKLFQGDIHTARNGLAVVAYMLLHASEIEMWLAVPADLAGKDPGEWLTIDYQSQDGQTDLWNMLPFALPGGSGTDKSEAGIQAKVAGFLGQNTGYDPRLADWLAALVKLADALDYRQVFSEEVTKSQTAFDAVWNNFNAVLAQCPAGYGCDAFEVSKDTEDRLGEFGFSYGNTPTFALVLFDLWAACTSRASAIQGAFSDGVSTDADIEAALEEVNRLIAAMRDVVLEFMPRVEEAIQEEKEKVAACARAREEVSKPELSIWEAIPCCLEDATLGRLKNSLDDWWGAKKYIVAAGAAIVNVPIIIASVGVAVLPAIGNFIGDFLTGMIGEGWQIVGDFLDCMFHKCEPDS